MIAVMGTAAGTVRPPPSTGDVIDQFRSAMERAGIEPPKEVRHG